MIRYRLDDLGWYHFECLVQALLKAELGLGVARSFPELLSLRDLDVLLTEVVQRDIVERSDAAIKLAKDLAPVFVATAAYQRALEILEHHSLLVLDGPPEMGKSAIAYMIALTQLLRGWQAVDARYPDDVLANLSRGRPQVFIVDDAFGRTEYDVTLGRRWERDLAKVLVHLNENHWLILTTRKHILARALRELDLTGRARTFPQPGELIVSADDLSQEEKARILYRHARSAPLSERLRGVIRERARSIVEDRHFTPERIRRLVEERLPEAENLGRGRWSVDLAEIVREAIRNPTRRMRTAFRGLPELHKRVLISLLDCERATIMQTLHTAVARLYQPVGKAELVETIEDLSSAFLRILQHGSSQDLSSLSRIDWIDPARAGGRTGPVSPQYPGFPHRSLERPQAPGIGKLSCKAP
ncbi:MAG: hypothetical protein ABUT39_06790 [Acidobacteriota bacterium]